MPKVTKENLRMLILWWVVLCGVLLWSQWRSKRSVGLCLAYVFGLSMIHLTGAFAYAMEFYEPRSAYVVQGGFGLQNTFVGFYVSVIGLASFVAANLICPFLFNKSRPRLLARHSPQVTTLLPGTLLLISVMFFFFLRPIFNRIPSLSSIANAGSYLSVISFALLLRRAYLARETSKFTVWLVATAMFPAITIITLGFAGFGIMAALTIWALTLHYFRPRWLSLLVFMCAIYCGLSLYVNYMRERESIRESVWNQKAVSSRMERAMRIFRNFEVFNNYNQTHLEMIDMRLNQNDLVGKAALYLQSGRVGEAQGGTFYAAALSVIPRILWPGKPATGGSGSLVSHFTGIKFAEGTAIGVGQVLEFYVNWRMPSVIIGFFLFGLIMTYLDQTSGDYLAQGDLWNAAKWLLPGTGMLMPEGSLAEVVGNVAGNTVFVLALNHFLFARYYDPANVLPPRQPGRGSRVPRTVR